MDVDEEGRGPTRTTSGVDLLASSKHMHCSSSSSSCITQFYGYSSSGVDAVRKGSGCYGPRKQRAWKTLHDDHQEYVGGSELLLGRGCEPRGQSYARSGDEHTIAATIGAALVQFMRTCTRTLEK